MQLTLHDVVADEVLGFVVAHSTYELVSRSNEDGMEFWGHKLYWGTPLLYRHYTTHTMLTSTRTHSSYECV